MSDYEISTELTKLRERVAWLEEAHRLDCDDLTNSRRILGARIDDLEGDVARPREEGRPMSDPNSFSSDGISGVERFLISHERHGVATPGTLEEAVLDLCLRARRDENRNPPQEGEGLLEWLGRVPGLRGTDGLADPERMSEPDWRVYLRWNMQNISSDLVETSRRVMQLIAAHDRSASLLARALKGEDPDEIMGLLADDIAKWEEHRDD